MIIIESAQSKNKKERKNVNDLSPIFFIAYFNSLSKSWSWIFILNWDEYNINRIRRMHMFEWYSLFSSQINGPFYCPVIWGCRIHRLHFCRLVRPPTPNEYPGYDTKQSDCEVPVTLGLWPMRSTPSLPSLPRSLWPEVVAPERVLSIDLIELNCVLMLNWIAWNRTVLKFKLGTYAKLD